ncbi:hypothetical protein AAZX31_08G265400 [Glycine max]
MGNKKPMIREVSRGHGISLQSHLLEPKFPHMFKSNNQPSNLCFHDRTSSQIPSEPINLPTICIMKHPTISTPLTTLNNRCIHVVLKTPLNGRLPSNKPTLQRRMLMHKDLHSLISLHTSEDSSINDIIDPPRSIIKYKIHSIIPNRVLQSPGSLVRFTFT